MAVGEKLVDAHENKTKMTSTFESMEVDNQLMDTEPLVPPQDKTSSNIHVNMEETAAGVTNQVQNNNKTKMTSTLESMEVDNQLMDTETLVPPQDKTSSTVHVYMEELKENAAAEVTNQVQNNNMIRKENIPLCVLNPVENASKIEDIPSTSMTNGNIRSEIPPNEDVELNGSGTEPQENDIADITSTSITNGNIGSKIVSNQDIELNGTGTEPQENDVELINLGQLVIDEQDYFNCKLFEIARHMWTSNSSKQHYTRGCLWSPDGTCCLVPVHLDGIHLFELPFDLYEKDATPQRPLTQLKSVIHYDEGGTVYDYTWYPFMNSSAPETCCWIATRQHEPIQMWDAFHGDLRATYRGYNDVDEVEAAISVAFSTDGEQVIGGYKKYFKIFSTDCPGRDCTTFVTKQAISAFAIIRNIITTGSWNGIINLFDQRLANMGVLSSLFGHTGGITWLKYSKDGTILYSGARKDNNLYVWDMRNMEKPIRSFQREVTNNQRIYFDLSPENNWLISGDTSGLVRAWNVNDTEPEKRFRLHNDSCNGVNFHPSKPIIATCSGQYHFTNPEEILHSHTTEINYENALAFWWIKPRESED